MGGGVVKNKFKRPLQVVPGFLSQPPRPQTVDTLLHPFRIVVILYLSKIAIFYCLKRMEPQNNLLAP